HHGRSSALGIHHRGRIGGQPSPRRALRNGNVRGESTRRETVQALRNPLDIHRSPDGLMIDRSFFERSPLVCARELIGAELVRGRCAGIIVETEAYSTRGDEACHTFLRPSARVFVSSHPAGTAYVYLNYGMHWLL